MTSVLLSLSFLAFANDPTLHDLPDGVVKVATQVIVQADNTQVRYDIGFNPTTLSQLVKKYAPDTKADATDAEKLEAFRKAFKAKIEDTIRLKVGDKLVKPQEVNVQPEEVSKHVQVRINLSYEILVDKESTIEIHDSGLQEMARIWTAGFKAALPIAVKESTTKAIPLRSRPTERAAGDDDPFIISGTVVRLSIGVESESSTSLAPLFVLMFALGSAGLVGILLVPNEPGDGHHDDHH